MCCLAIRNAKPGSMPNGELCARTDEEKVETVRDGSDALESGVCRKTEQIKAAESCWWKAGDEQTICAYFGF